MKDEEKNSERKKEDVSYIQIRQKLVVHRLTHSLGASKHVASTLGLEWLRHL